MLNKFLSVLFSAVLWHVLMGLAGFSLLVSGIYLLAGDGWAFLGAGLSCVAISAYIQRGLNG